MDSDLDKFVFGDLFTTAAAAVNYSNMRVYTTANLVYYNTSIPCAYYSDHIIVTVGN